AVLEAVGSTTRTRTPAVISAAATTQASPPLLPAPARTSTPESRRSRNRSAISPAAAAPARCISARDGMPRAMADASPADDSSLVRTGTSGRTSSQCPRLLLRGTDGATVAQFTVVDSDIEPAPRVAARPGFVGNRCAVAPIVAQTQQRANLALATRGPFGWLVHFLPTSPLHTLSFRG